MRALLRPCSSPSTLHSIPVLGRVIMASTTWPEEDELGTLYEYGYVFEEDAHERVTRRHTFGKDVCVQLTYAQERDDVQTDNFVPPAAPALCAYLEKHRDEIPEGTIVELGAGCGLTGLAIAQLKPNATVVFTDQDPGVLKTIAHNSTQQSAKQATCLTNVLRWGPEGASELESLLANHSATGSGVDMIVGTDVIYMREVVSKLFWSVDQLLSKSATGTFLMCSSSRYDDATEAEIDAECARFGLARTILSCKLEETTGGSRIQKFTRVQV